MHLSTQTWMRPEPLEQTLKRASRLGYSSIELAGEPSLYHVQETRQLLDKYGMHCWGTVTMQYGKRDLTAADESQRRDTIQYMKDVVLLCSELGGSIVTVVPARVGKLVPTSAPELEWKWAVEGLREVASFAEARKVRIGLEPLNRFETYFLNRVDQALALADEVGHGCGIAFDPFHLALEEEDMFAAMRACGPRIVDFHVADHNRQAAGDGNFDWPKIMSALAATGYDGGLAVEFMPPIDRTPVGRFGADQLETDAVDVSPDQLQFILDHGSGLFSDTYYTGLLRRSAETIQPFLS
ncbi:xylose isomerase-like protein [Massariosphaeria phaeospora]|uniref:Xylose isomerase-like protein n=1 Tax=Massariosphaeria phaeospora TaxID=100035 RepID=A0A7C8M7S6_9PLEO|nr:xylose isomerase-like protein [Massariosphaeria phaeospora]